MDFLIEGNAVTFWLKVKPRSARERMELDGADELCLRIHAPPVEGQGNAACIEFLARALRLPPSSVSIVAGGKSRRKRIRIATRSPHKVIAQLNGLAKRELSGGSS
ncbi:MAG TPA: DUF167 domain-containing protein [Terriglobia bacterium]|nr:DUF167 domain-containing protein [Terriglobia bacterium]